MKKLRNVQNVRIHISATTAVGTLHETYTSRSFVSRLVTTDPQLVLSTVDP